jgi:hypothetical protein
MQNVFRAAERPLGIDNPLIAKQRSRERSERLRVGKRFTSAEESKLVFSEKLL